MLTTEEIRFSYRHQMEILKAISFSQEKGHCLAILGNNGAGKTTLLKCLNRILQADGGRIMVEGRDLAHFTRNEIARTFSYVEQYSETCRLTVFDAVLLGRRPYLRAEPKEEDIRMTEEALSRMKMEDYALRSLNELSGGELQKVMLARALVQEPDILLLDEPTASLDLCSQHEVMKLAARIAREDQLLVIVVIHDLNLALRYCDRFLFLKDGRIFRFGDSSILTEELISDIYQIPVSLRRVDGQTIILVP